MLAHPTIVQPDVQELIMDLDYGSIAVSISSFILSFLVILVLGLYLFIPAVRRALARTDTDEVVQSLLGSTLRAVVWIGAFVIAMAIAGYGAFLSAFAIFGSAIALAVGFASQDLLGNFVAGIFIMMDKPFEVGDWIEWDDRRGVIEDIDLRVSRVRTFDNEQITVPNSELANNAVVNPVAYETLRQRFTFGIGYDEDIDEATDVILETIGDHPDVLDNPEPTVRLVELGDSDVGLEARWWIDDPARGDFLRVQSEVVADVKEAFDQAAIEIPYAHRELTGAVEIEGFESQQSE